MQLKNAIIATIATMALVATAISDSTKKDLMIDCIEGAAEFLESMSIDPDSIDLNDTCNLCISRSLHKCGMPDPSTLGDTPTCYNTAMARFRFERGVGGVPVQTAED